MRAAPTRVKGNQPTMLDDIRLTLDETNRPARATVIDEGAKPDGA